ncbi:MAG: LytS/YhcK type 5TM receptor domain-containing protein, partial [Clostridium sp.]|nr:LytS/YhcK type 5TM receptor domain-containing protein [Clostridium sp.]
MRNDVIMSICMNITLLVALAVLLTKLEFVQEILLNVERPEEEESRSRQLKNQLFLGLIFGVFCIISDYIGMQVEGAIPNARVIGVLSAGFLGGPVSGMTTA